MPQKLKVSKGEVIEVFIGRFVDHFIVKIIVVGRGSIF
jgi:hypothetical protein